MSFDSSQAYSVTKAAQIHMVKGLANAAGPNIRVNSISPGLMLTVEYLAPIYFEFLLIVLIGLGAFGLHGRKTGGDATADQVEASRDCRRRGEPGTMPCKVQERHWCQCRDRRRPVALNGRCRELRCIGRMYPGRQPVWHGRSSAITGELVYLLAAPISRCSYDEIASFSPNSHCSDRECRSDDGLPCRVMS